jgi:hypothetical protein
MNITENTLKFIALAKKNHVCNEGNPLFDYPNTLFIKTASQEEKVEIICKKHGPCLVVPRHHLSNPTGGCSKCRAEKTSASKIEKSKKQWEQDILTTHLFLNGTSKYDYSKFVFTKRKESSIIICKACKEEGRFPFEFSQSPNHHIDRKQGCNTCSNIKNGLNQSTPLDEYIMRCSEKHRDIYGYDKIHETYKSGRSIIQIYCKECEEYFSQMAESHISGRGCIKCGLVRTTLAKLSNTETFVEKAKQIGHNHIICDYSKTIYVSAREKLHIKCILCNIEYPITPNNHLRGKGCPTCYHHTSRTAREWLSYIQSQKGIILQTFDSEDGEYIINGTRWKADGYDPHTNTIYEFHGDYWHGNPKKYSCDTINKTTKKTMGELYNKTLERDKRIIELGYNLIIMWEMDWIQIKSAL